MSNTCLKLWGPTQKWCVPSLHAFTFLNIIENERINRQIYGSVERKSQSFYHFLCLVLFRREAPEVISTFIVIKVTVFPFYRKETKVEWTHSSYPSIIAWWWTLWPHLRDRSTETNVSKSQISYLCSSDFFQHICCIIRKFHIESQVNCSSVINIEFQKTLYWLMHVWKTEDN